MKELNCLKKDYDEVFKNWELSKKSFEEVCGKLKNLESEKGKMSN